MGLDILRLDTKSGGVQGVLTALRQRTAEQAGVTSEASDRRTIEVFGRAMAPSEVVETICREVREHGLAAVLDYSRRIDRAELSADRLRVSKSELEAAHAIVPKEFLETVRRIRDNVLRFQCALLPRDVRIELPRGAYLIERYQPLARVGVCVPGGAAAYPSTVLMTAVLAQAAGVCELAIVAPPTPTGANNREVLATCHELGITEVYRIGGAQGVAALAYGIEGVPRVDKIVGPGNVFVALAKKYVYGEVDIDAIAGPSEVVIVADESARADWVAADLIAQAEHAPGVSILIAWSRSLLDETAVALERQLRELARGELARASLESFGALVLARNSSEAIELANTIAPEHLHLAVENAERVLSDVVHAGAVFIGHDSPVAVGDYVAGPSHVLPTGGTARFASGLSALDFLRRSSVICFSKETLREAAGDVGRMADVEGLTAHRASVDRRLE